MEGLIPTYMGKDNKMKLAQKIIKCQFFLLVLFLSSNVESSEMSFEKAFSKASSEWCKYFSTNKDNPIFLYNEKFCLNNSKALILDDDTRNYLNYFNNKEHMIDFLSDPIQALIKSGFFEMQPIVSNKNYTIKDVIELDKKQNTAFKNLKVLSNKEKCKRGNYNDCYGRQKINRNFIFEGEWKDGCLTGKGKAKFKNMIQFGSFVCGTFYGNGFSVIYEENDNKKISFSNFKNDYVSGLTLTIRRDKKGTHYSVYNAKDSLVQGVLLNIYIYDNINNGLDVGISGVVDDYLHGDSITIKYITHDNSFSYNYTSYFEDKNSGFEFYFDPTATFKKTGSYIFSSLDSDGQKTGAQINNHGNDDFLFIGETFKNNIHGYAYHKVNTKEYYGRFKFNTRHGPGILNDGKKSSKGLFLKDKKQGEFISCYADGSIMKELYNNDAKTDVYKPSEDELGIYYNEIIDTKKKLNKLFYYSKEINSECDFEFRESVKNYLEDENLLNKQFILDLISSSSFKANIRNSIKRIS